MALVLLFLKKQNHTFLFFAFLRYNAHKGGESNIKYTKQPKRYLCLSDFEWRVLVKGINDFRNQVINDGGCVEDVNKLLIKLIDAPTKKIKVITEELK